MASNPICLISHLQRHVSEEGLQFQHLDVLNYFRLLHRDGFHNIRLKPSVHSPQQSSMTNLLDLLQYVRAQHRPSQILTLADANQSADYSA